MYTRILVPTDGSSVSELAARAAIELARACGSSIVALSVAVPERGLPYVEGGMVPDPGQQADALLEHARGFVGTLAQSVRHAGIDCTPITRIDLNPAQAIVTAAREYSCDLIAMGSHGRRGLSRLLAGSVTQEVLACAAVPVMVFRPALPGDLVRELARSCPASGQG